MKLTNTNQTAGRPPADVMTCARLSRRAFSLLEVMIAIAVLFIGTFAILGLISSSLENARRLQRPLVDASALVSQLSMTNKLIEGEYSGNLGDVLGKSYSDYRYTAVIVEVQSNKLFEADYKIYNAGGGNDVISRTTTLFFRPESPAGSLDGGHFGQ
jgi:hypothetical protein